MGKAIPACSAIVKDTVGRPGKKKSGNIDVNQKGNVLFLFYIKAGEGRELGS